MPALRKSHAGHIVAETGNPRQFGGRCRAERRGRGRFRHGRCRLYERRSQGQRMDQRASNCGPRGGSYSVRTVPILLRQSIFRKRNLTPKNETRRRIVICPLAAAQCILRRNPQSSIIETRRHAPFCDNRLREPRLASVRRNALDEIRLLLTDLSRVCSIIIDM